MEVRRRRRATATFVAAVAALAAVASSVASPAAAGLQYPSHGAAAAAAAVYKDGWTLPDAVCSRLPDGGCSERIAIAPSLLTAGRQATWGAKRPPAKPPSTPRATTHTPLSINGAVCAALGASCSAVRPCCAGGAAACIVDPMIAGGAPHCAYGTGAFRGTTLAPKARWDTLTTDFDATVRALPRAGFDCVALVFYAFMSDTRSTAFHYNYSTAGEPVSADPTSIVRAIQRIHGAGLCVILKPHIALETRQWRGYVEPSDKFMDAYRSWVLGWVDVAERMRVEAVAIGSEWKLVEKDGAGWRRIIREARSRYRGWITYGVNFDSYRELSFHDALDFVSIDAYFEVAPPPPAWPAAAVRHPYATVLAGWKRVAAEIDSWRAATVPTLPVCFLEAGVRSVVGAASYPWQSQPPFDGRTDTADPQGQADFYTAMFAALRPYTWWRGQFQWEWLWGDAARRSGGAAGKGYTVQGKPAEVTLTRLLRGKTERALPLVPAIQGGGGARPLRLSYPKTPL